MQKTIAIIDCDFFNHITETSQDISSFSNVIVDLNIDPVVHEYVYKQELFSSPHASEMVELGLMRVEKFDDFINANNENEYKRHFENIYKYANSRDIQYINTDYRTYRKSNENLGEIHSICLAMIKKYPLLLSDDSGAKSINRMIESKSRISVKNIYDIYREIATMKHKTTTKNSFINVMRFSGVKKAEVRLIKAGWIGQ